MAAGRPGLTQGLPLEVEQLGIFLPRAWTVSEEEFTFGEGPLVPPGVGPAPLPQASQAPCWQHEAQVSPPNHSGTWIDPPSTCPHIE